MIENENEIFIIFSLESAPVSKWNGGNVGTSTSGSFSNFRSNNTNDENSNPSNSGSFGFRNNGNSFGSNVNRLRSH